MHSFYNDGQATSLKISILLVAWLFPHGCTYKHMDITFTVIMGKVSINSFEFHQLLFLVAHRIVSWKSLTQTVTYSPFSFPYGPNSVPLLDQDRPRPRFTPPPLEANLPNFSC